MGPLWNNQLHTKLVDLRNMQHYLQKQSSTAPLYCILTWRHTGENQAGLQTTFRIHLNNPQNKPKLDAFPFIPLCLGGLSLMSVALYMCDWATWWWAVGPWGLEEARSKVPWQWFITVIAPSPAEPGGLPDNLIIPQFPPPGSLHSNAMPGHHLFSTKLFKPKPWQPWSSRLPSWTQLVDSSTATIMETFKFLKLLVVLKRVKLVFRFSCVATTVGAFELLVALKWVKLNPVFRFSCMATTVEGNCEINLHGDKALRRLWTCKEEEKDIPNTEYISKRKKFSTSYDYNALGISKSNVQLCSR